MRRGIPFALLALLLFAPTWAGSPAELDTDELRALMLEKTERATLAEGRFRASGQSANVLKPGTKEVWVNCDDGQSLNAELGKHPFRYLFINVSGTCRESVVVERVGVTLSGTAAGGAIIEPTEGPAIRAEWAHGLALYDLTLTRGTDGLLALASREMVIERVQAVDNRDYGIFLESSTANITDVELSRNATAIIVRNHSTAYIFNAMMEDNYFDGPFALNNSYMWIRDSTMLNNGFGPNGYERVTIHVWDSTVEFPGSTAITGVWRDGTMHLRRSTVYTQLAAWSKSQIQFQASTIGTDEVKPDFWAAWDSYLDVWDGGAPTVIKANVWVLGSSRASFDIAEPIRGDVFVFMFGEGAFYTGTPIQGSMTCWDRGRAFCWPDDPVGGMVDCE